MKFFKETLCLRLSSWPTLDRILSYSMLKTFVLAETISTVATTSTSSNAAAASQAAKTATVTDSSYKDDNISVNLSETTVNNTQVYVLILR